MWSNLRALCLLFFWAGLLLPFRAAAQPVAEPQSFAWTMDQCVEYALVHNQAVKDARLAREVSEQEVREILGAAWPQVFASFDFTYNPDVQRGVVPAQFFDPTATEGEVAIIEFGTSLNLGGGFGLNQLIFDATYFIGLEATKQIVELQTRGIRQSEVEAAAQVRKAYLTVLVNEKRLDLLRTNLANLAQLRTETQALAKEGYVESIDADRLDVTYNNLETQLRNAEALVKLTMNLLKFQMGMKQDVDLQLTERLDESVVSGELLDQPMGSYDQRPEYRFLQQGILLQDYNIRRYRANYYPRLMGNASLRWQSFGNDFEAVGNGDNWFRVSSLGVGLSWTLFDGLATDARVQKAKLQKRDYEQKLENLERGIDLEVATARVNLSNALRSLESQRKNLELAQRVLNVTRVKYAEGLGSQLEVIQAQNEVTTAQTNYSDALLGAHVARVDLLRAVGQLYVPEGTEPN